LAKGAWHHFQLHGVKMDTTHTLDLPTENKPKDPIISNGTS
jgi:hypothetical protein